ncbi:MAG TPA: competence/damage-inducible protein A [Candidatus Margulisiibacteriota bacterium]|nr:competence/damage-inducible protein A [Candidatus Margulisiibacteriota bacterium]
MRDKSAAIIVIGNEILSGKVVDTNAAFLAKELRTLGVGLQRILVIPDELDAIAEAVGAYQPAFDILFTSGGVGPTHDDVTIAGIARGLRRRVIRHPLLEEKIREYSGDKISEARLKMAEIPEGAELVFEGSLNFPIVLVENIYILPGIPELFRDKFLAMKTRFAVDPYFMRVIYTRAIESSIARYLNATLDAFPLLQLGSYPKLSDPEYRVRVTLESKDRDYLDRAFAHLVAQLPPESIVRTE